MAAATVTVTSGGEAENSVEKHFNRPIPRLMSTKAFEAGLKRVPVPVWVGVCVVVGVALVAGLARAAKPSVPKLTGQALTAARALLTSAAQLSKQADQDQDDTQRAKDVYTGLAYVSAARFLAPDSVLEQRCGVKVDELAATLRAQDRAGGAASAAGL